MSKNLMDSVAPVLSVPVERQVVPAPADVADEVGQSLLGITLLCLTFAGEDQE